MTNEQYLRISYFAAAGCGIILAAITAAILKGPHRAAVAGAAAGVGKILRRAFPAWLVLAALLGFISVSYFDCTHETYQKIVLDRQYLHEKTREQASTILYWLSAAIAAYGLLLAILLGVLNRQRGTEK